MHWAELKKLWSQFVWKNIYKEAIFRVPLTWVICFTTAVGPSEKAIYVCMHSSGILCWNITANWKQLLSMNSTACTSFQKNLVAKLETEEFFCITAPYLPVFLGSESLPLPTFLGTRDRTQVGHIQDRHSHYTISPSPPLYYYWGDQFSFVIIPETYVNLFNTKEPSKELNLQLSCTPLRSYFSKIVNLVFLFFLIAHHNSECL